MNDSQDQIQNVTTYDFDLTFLSTLTLLYIPLCVSSLLGNVGMLIAIKSDKDLKTSVNVFIFNLTLTNFYYTCIFVPIQLSMYWKGKETLSCAVVRYLSTTMNLLQASFFIIIAVNRMFVICLPVSVSSSVFTITKSIIYCVLLWILSIGKNVSTIVEGSRFNEVYKVCDARHFDTGKRLLPLLSVLSCGVVVVVIYIVIWVTVKKSKDKMISRLGFSQLKDSLKVTKLTFLLFVMYILFLIPAMIISIVDPLRQSNPVYPAVTYFITEFNPLLNVVIYAGLNSQIRNVMKQMFCQFDSQSDSAHIFTFSEWARRRSSVKPLERY